MARTTYDLATKKQYLKAQKASGVSVNAYEMENGLPKNTLGRWKKQVGKIEEGSGKKKKKRGKKKKSRKKKLEENSSYAGGSIEVIDHVSKYPQAPIAMILYCPMCHGRHIDSGRMDTHRTHACEHCGHLWAPAAVPTIGVQFLPGMEPVG